MLLGIIGGSELIVILVLALLIFGGKKIPELMRGLGRGIREYKNGLSEISNAGEQENKPGAASGGAAQNPGSAPADGAGESGKK